MAKKCAMLEHPSTDPLEEEEIELSLGLSIGRSPKKSRPSIDTNADLMRACKRARVETTSHDNEGQSAYQNVALNPTAYVASLQSYPRVPVHAGAVQYVPFVNGLGLPYVMPCWTVGNETNVIHPVACRPFKEDRLSSSAISDHPSTTSQGGSSSNSRGHSSHSNSMKPPSGASTGSDTQGQSEHSACSHPLQSTRGINKATENINRVVSSNIVASGATIPNTEAALEIQSNQANKLISATENPNPGPLKENEGNMGKPPKPQSQNHDIPQLPHMPCVSTTGNGPNGKTITGFLYRYTKTEVSIVCVCHGSSFTPAEFVEHAGGIDVSHPLRHITVVPSAFG